MRKGYTFPEYAERVLIAGMVVGILLIAQRFSVTVFKVGLYVLVGSTLLQIAVGNVPKDMSFGPSLVRIAIILVGIACVFGLGIWLVPTFSHLGR